MKILKLTAENIKKLKVVEIVPNGSVVQITGPNGSGKSSVLDAIYYALAGTKDIPSQPIRKGTQKASVKLDLGEVTVIRRFTEGGTTLVVEGEKGSRFPSPQRMLDDLLGTLTFDPLAFSRMDAKKQLEELRGMVKLEEDIDALDVQNAADYAKRTELNRQAKAIEGQMAGIVVPCNTPDKPMDVSELLHEMEEAGKHNSGIERIKSEAASRKRHAEELEERATKLRSDIERMNQEIKQLESDAIKDRKASQVALPLEIDTNALRQKIEYARTINEQVQEKSKYAALASQAANLDTQAANLSSAIQERQERRQKVIAEAAMPVPGLSFGQGEILFNGLPFNQASDAEQLRISIAIAMASNPKLRVLRIRDGSLLDEKSLANVAAMADLNDYQIWIERVETSGKVGVVMEDGAVVAQQVDGLDDL